MRLEKTAKKKSITSTLLTRLLGSLVKEGKRSVEDEKCIQNISRKNLRM
jgi:hypothetical protein